jgi:hypothetical protein
MSGVRFTTWLSLDERGALRKLAKQQECSENIIVRHAIRAVLFGSPIPSYLQKENASNEAPIPHR